jgi:hypothetical protein
MQRMGIRAAVVALALVVSACGDDIEADKLGVGAECSNDDHCLDDQRCLSFKGGYCGLSGCSGDGDCPEGSACIAHEGSPYCFRVCAHKSDCNRNRARDNEANCASNAVFVDGVQGRKACVPPSGT